jgi:hypothetical protein
MAAINRAAAPGFAGLADIVDRSISSGVIGDVRQ